MIKDGILFANFNTSSAGRRAAASLRFLTDPDGARLLFSPEECRRAARYASRHERYCPFLCPMLLACQNRPLCAVFDLFWERFDPHSGTWKERRLGAR